MALQYLMWGDATDLGVDSQRASSLRNLQLLLQKAIDRSPKQGKKIYEEIILLTQALVNASLGGHPASIACQPLASQAATVVLSMVSYFNDLVPDLGHIIERDQKYIDSLWPQVMAVKTALNSAYEAVVGSLGSHQTVDMTYSDRLLQCSKQLQTSLDAFEMRISFFLADPELVSRKTKALHDNGDGYDFTWNDIELKQALNGSETAIWGKVGQGRSNMGSFWDNTFEAGVKGRVAVVKTYSTPEKFAMDLETMKSRRHPNLPSLFGHSGPTTSTPFIVLSIESFTPFWEHLPAVCSQSPESAIEETWRMLVSMRSATKYLLTRLILGNLRDDQLPLLENDLTECVEAAVVDPSGKLIISPDLLQPRFGKSKLVDPSNYLSIARAVPNKVIETFFSIPMPSSHGGSIDRLPSLLRPLRWAIVDNPTDLLHPSSARLQSNAFIMSAIRSHRPEPSMRNQLWPAYGSDSPESKWTVGDVGRFVLSEVDGNIEFVQYCNIQRELGGFSKTKFVRVDPMFVKYDLQVSSGIALDVFSRCVKDIARKWRVHPTELVLITQTTHTATNHTAAASLLPDNDPFNIHGRLHPTHWMPSSPGSEPSESIRFFTDHRFVQIEQDELDGSNDQFLRPANIGDIGYYAKEFDGGCPFHVICASGLVDISTYFLKAWEGNGCVYLGDGIWRSLVISEPNAVLSWNVIAYTGLPPKLEELYWFWLATKGETMPLRPENARKLQMTDDIDVQVRITLGDSDGRPPPRVFVHFNNQCQPVRVYFSQFDMPDVVPLAYPPWEDDGCDISIVTNRNHGRYGLEQAGSPLNFYRKVESVDHHQLQPRNIKVGDLGYFQSSVEGRTWTSVGNIGLISAGRQVSLSACDQVGWKCIKVSNKLWKASYQAPDSTDVSTDGVIRLNLQWTEDLFASCLPDFPWVPGYCASLQAGMGPVDIAAVSRIVVDVHASAPENALRKNLVLFTSFPTEGGCFVYWSPDDHTDINERALAQLDLDNWQPARCSVQVNTAYERIAVDAVADILNKQHWIWLSGYLNSPLMVPTATCLAVVIAAFVGYLIMGW